MTQINTHYTRSINLQRDQNSQEAVATYLPTSRAIQTLNQISTTLHQDSAPRSWALIGPYGSGKSAFALYLAALFSERSGNLYQSAQSNLSHRSPTLAASIAAATSERGMLPILINGTPERFSLSLNQALKRVAVRYQLTLAPFEPQSDGLNDLLDRVESLQQQWAARGGSGVLLAIDELGKFLEYQSHHTDAQEIHLLQLLAEQGQRAHAAPLYTVVMLHQAFEYYAQGIGKRLRDEWRKVQGRFESIAFIEPTEQVLPLIARVFDATNSIAKPVYTQIAVQLEQAGALPSTYTAESAAQLFQQCQPLHPITLLLLPMLCQKLAQNERTLFTYLGSQEPHSLQQTLNNLPEGEWIGPWHLFDYFANNQPGLVADATTRHRWVEIESALSRMGDEEGSLLQRLLKTVGLLNLIGIQRGLKASDAVLTTLFRPDLLQEGIAQLKSHSCINYRTFSQEYRIWQGSDFDIQLAIEQQRQQSEQQSLAKILNEQHPLAPLVTRRLTIESGTLRYYQAYFIDSETVSMLSKCDEVQPHLWFYLRRNEEESTPSIINRPYDVLVDCYDNEPLREAVVDWLILYDLPKHQPLLHHDPVAEREHKNWLESSERILKSRLHDLLWQPQRHRWLYQGEVFAIAHRRELQQRLSEWMARCYMQTPKIKSELINRDKISASAHVGRKKLLQALLSNVNQYNLGFPEKKYPPEKSIYLSILLQSGLHKEQEIGDTYHLTKPHPDYDPCNMLPWWEAVTAYLHAHEGEQVSLLSLYERLKAPPFGIKEGVLPLLIVVYLMVNQRDVSIYQDGTLITDLTSPQIEMLCRRPQFFTLEQFHISGIRSDIFNRYFEGLLGKKVTDDAKLLDIVKPLVIFIKKLPEYSSLTRSLSPTTLAVREAFNSSHSPSKLLFELLPQACGMSEFFTDQAKHDFIQTLVAALRELDGAYARLLDEWRKQLAERLLSKADVELNISTLRQRLYDYYRDMESLTPDKRVLGAFLARLTQENCDDTHWLESIATLIGRAPPAKWSDAQKAYAETQLNQLAIQARELQQLRLALGEADSNQKGVLLKWIDGSRGSQSRVVLLDSVSQERVNEKREAAQTLLNDLGEEEQWAVLALLLQKRFNECDLSS